jgi:hypothetical protein
LLTDLFVWATTCLGRPSPQWLTLVYAAGIFCIFIAKDYSERLMRRWRFLIAILTVVALAALGVRHVLQKREQQKWEQQKREVAYQSALLAYSETLKPGMTRKEVEDYLRAKNVGFRLMCCVDFRNSSKGVYDELTKIGQEDAPWACSEKNIYVAFQFTRPERNAAGWDANDSDTLKAITIFRWLEGCL